MSFASSLWRWVQAHERLLYWIAWWLLALALAAMIWLGQTGHGATHDQMNIEMGLWGTWLLIASLAIAPAANLLRMPELMRYRRALGLFALAYSAVHALDYTLYAHIWEGNMRFWGRRIYILIGIGALLLMLPLAVTSADALRRRMGPSAWKTLHRWVYAIAVLVVVHALWEGPIDYSQQWICTAAIAVLLIVRLPAVRRALQPRLAVAAGGN